MPHLLFQAAFYDKPVILSTGCLLCLEIEQALGVLAFGYLNKHDNPSIEKF